MKMHHTAQDINMAYRTVKNVANPLLICLIILEIFENFEEILAV